jgi:hypothetical protein
LSTNNKEKAAKTDGDLEDWYEKHEDPEDSEMKRKCWVLYQLAHIY